MPAKDSLLDYFNTLLRLVKCYEKFLLNIKKQFNVYNFKLF